MIRKEISNEISGRQTWRYAEMIAQNNRIQGSPGFRKAVEDIVSALARENVEVAIHRYPAKCNERFMAMPSFQEWRCSGAELWLLKDGERSERLCRYNENEVSLVQRSSAAPAMKLPLVVIPDSENPQSYKGLDLKGKLALVRGKPMHIYPLAVEQAGASGLLFDNLNEFKPLRTRLDMPDGIQYNSFWWYGEGKHAFGFTVTPRTGEELRKLAEKEEVCLEAWVDADLYDGNFENLEFFIPGKKKQEVLLISHLCHPYPGAQDNASGSAVTMEVIRVLKRLLDSGQLPPPELGIRFLLVPEMTGTYAWFAGKENRERTIAALNLDMVGADQKNGGGPLCVEQPPLSTPSFEDRLVFSLLDEISRDVANLSGTQKYSTCNYLQTKFSGGSDHYIISDPMLGIACPMLIQWPDLFYHTSLDHPKNLDPGMLARVANTAANYLWTLAAGSEEEWEEYLLQAIPSSYNHLLDNMKWAFSQPALAGRWEEVLAYYQQYEKVALERLFSYVSNREFKNFTARKHWAQEQLDAQNEIIGTWCREQAIIAKRSEGEKKELSEGWADRIYERVYPGPTNLMFEILSLPASKQVAWNQKVADSKAPHIYTTLMEYYVDGKKTVQEILLAVEIESGAWHPGFAVEWFKISEELKLLRRIT